MHQKLIVILMYLQMSLKIENMFLENNMGRNNKPKCIYFEERLLKCILLTYKGETGHTYTYEPVQNINTHPIEHHCPE